MRSLINYNGLPETSDFAGSLPYIYGLSDFWQVWFEDKEVLDRTMEATSYQLSEVYSKFLQLCSTISLSAIRETFHSDLRLLLVNTSAPLENQVAGSFPYAYLLEEKVLGIRYLFNKPMFPTKTFEDGVHFRVENGVLYLTKPIEQLGLATRKVLVDGVEYNQFSVWASDVEIDEQLLWKYFGQFVRVGPSTSTRLFKDYIQGLFFLYSNGPSLDLLARGLNLALGIPLARDNETVLRIIQDPETGNWSIITANNSYTIPYQIAPVVEEGDELVVGQEVSWVAQVQDYKSQDSWWINLAIPRELLKDIPSNVPTTAIKGSTFDYLMRKFLKYHTFLVQIDINADFDSASMTEMIRLVKDARPSYTFPVFVWRVPIEDDPLLEDDSELSYSQKLDMVDTLLLGEYLRRDHEEEDIAGERSGRVFIHSNGNLVGYTGDTVDVSHRVLDGLTGNTYLDILDSTLKPLYNITLTDLKEYLIILGFTLPAALPNRFRLTNLALTTNYSTVVVRDPISTTPGMGYNNNELNGWDGEVRRCFIPLQNHAAYGVNDSDEAVFLEVEHGLYSVFVVRPSNLLFDPVYFPPAEEDRLTVTQVPV